ncbi:MAG: pirin family protein [Bdellovibrionales bacterium]|nr:pirin family protein [Bdellovibrionales bacterium]
MSLNQDEKLDTTCSNQDAGAKSQRTIFAPSEKDLGDGFKVNRMLPRNREGRKMVGPFIFWDHMGPVEVKKPEQMAVRPHPHIGLATLTYLFSGGIMHKDSLGYEQPIRPGEVNWMVAGKGIVHSERTAPLEGIVGQHIHGIQSWIALPKEYEEIDPAFYHYPKEEMPVLQVGGSEMTLVAGTAQGQASPVKIYSDTLYLVGDLKAGDEFELQLDSNREAAVYAPQSKIEVDGEPVDAKSLVIYEVGECLKFKVLEDGPITIFGGEPFPEDRHIFWNFVSTSKERIQKAKEDWKGKRFDMVEGDDEFIPLP